MVGSPLVVEGDLKEVGAVVLAVGSSSRMGVPKQTLRRTDMARRGAGAKGVIKTYASEAHFLSFPDGEVDMDTPEDFSRLTIQGIERQHS